MKHLSKPQLVGMGMAGVRLRDLPDLEAAMGRPIGALFEALASGDLAEVDAMTFAGMIWLRMRRDDPGLTFEAVLDLDLGALEEEADDDPKDLPGPTPLRVSGSASPGPGGAHLSRSATSTSAS
jgi:hypothetical protein